MTLYINGKWLRGLGPQWKSLNPATGELVWEGHEASAQQVSEAIAAARAAFPAWADLAQEEREKLLEQYKAKLNTHKEGFAELISRETGKPLWETRGELTAMIGKVDLSIEAQRDRCKQLYKELPHAISLTRHKPHGVVAVFGPFNFPGHLPNGHIVPALLAGNTVVFKPSEITPAVAERMVKLWEEAGLPPGVLNLVQGGRTTGEALAAHTGIDGLFFTGSSATGRKLHEAFGPHPEKILAVEMGGNNPLICWEVTDLQAAAYTIIQSAFITTGQRCTCARRLILPTGPAGDAIVSTLVKMMEGIQVGKYTDNPEPFMGPLVDPLHAQRVMDAQAALQKAGGRWLVKSGRPDPIGAFITPGLMDVTDVPHRPDEEIFGPFLQVIRVTDYDAAIAEANNTRYGLAAGLISNSPELWRRFFRRCRAGIVNWNTQTTGASSAAPFPKSRI